MRPRSDVLLTHHASTCWSRSLARRADRGPTRVVNGLGDGRQRRYRARNTLHHAGSLERGYGCRPCSRRRVFGPSRTRYLESVSDVRIGAACGARAALGAHQSRATNSERRRGVCAPVCAISPSRLSRASRPTCARAPPPSELLAAGRRRSVKARRERSALRGSNSGCERRTTALVRASATCPRRTAAGGRARFSSRSRYRRKCPGWDRPEAALIGATPSSCRRYRMVDGATFGRGTRTPGGDA